jgi:Fe-S cluster biogenesis protein NfuA
VIAEKERIGTREVEELKQLNKLKGLNELNGSSNSTAQPSLTEPASSSQLVCLAPPKKEAPRQNRKLEELILQAEQVGDPAARALLHECLQSLLAFYGEGLARMIEIVREGEAGDPRVFDRLVNDPVVRGLLLIHGLHPVDLPTRLRQALEKVRPYMESHGGNVELLALQNDVAMFRLQGTCKTCPASSVTLELALRHAIEEACPDLQGFEVEGIEPPPP